jgi:branched-chain amino acid aminotransferase
MIRGTIHRCVGVGGGGKILCRSITSSSLTITPHGPASLAKLNSHRPHPTQLKFGHTFGPHMLQIQYENERWESPTIVPYGDLRISPAASALHYGMECFEGMKAYRALLPSSSSSSPSSSNNSSSSSSISSNNNNNDNNDSSDSENVDLRLFRPEKNMERLRNSMKRLGMPGTNFDTNEVIECIKELVRLGECILIERKMMRKYDII